MVYKAVGISLGIHRCLEFDDESRLIVRHSVRAVRQP